MQQFDLFLFDMDGTLVNSEPLKGQAIAKACAEFGGEADYQIYKQVMGESWSVVTGHFFEHLGISPNLEQFNVRFRKHYEQLLSEHLTLTRGARQYLDWLQQQGKRSAVVSSAAPWMVEWILRELDLVDAFELVITQADVTQHKPHPEAYLLALSKLDTPAERAVVFEDSNAGVRAGVAAGCKVIAVQHQFNGNNDLSAALDSIDDFEQLMLEMVNSDNQQVGA